MNKQTRNEILSMFKNGVLIIGLDNRVTVDKSGTPITGLSKQQ